VRIFEKEVKVAIDVHVNDNRSILDDIVMQIFKIFLSIPQQFYPRHQIILFFVV
jgi:hypothetical protein